MVLRRGSELLPVVLLPGDNAKSIGTLLVPGVLEGGVPVFGVVLKQGDKESVPLLWFTSQKNGETCWVG